MSPNNQEQRKPTSPPAPNEKREIKLRQKPIQNPSTVSVNDISMLANKPKPTNSDVPSNKAEVEEIKIDEGEEDRLSFMTDR